jgi:hypothetical protein
MINFFSKSCPKTASAAVIYVEGNFVPIANVVQTLENHFRNLEEASQAEVLVGGPYLMGRNIGDFCRV